MSFLDTTWYLKDNGTVGYSGVTKWAANTATSVGQIRRPLTTPSVGNERCYIAVASTGNTGSSEPTWPTTRGSTVTDGSVTWMEATGQAALNGDSTNTTKWAALKAASGNASQGQIIQDAASDTYFICTTPNSMGSSEPTWNKTAGATTTDGSAVWTSLGAISNFSTPYAAPHARLSNSMQSTWLMFPGTIYVSNNHAETRASADTWPNIGSSIPSPVKIICVSDSAAPPTALATTASISTTGANSDISTGNGTAVYYYGLNLNASNSTNEGSILFNHESQYWENCTFTLNNSNSSSNFGDQYGYNADPFMCSFRNCNFVFGSTSQNFNENSNISSLYEGCNFAKTGSVPTSLFLGAGFTGRSNWAILRDCDLSAITGTIFDGSAFASIRGISGYAPYRLENCKLGSGVTVWANGGDYAVYTTPTFLLLNSDSANTNYRYLKTCVGGTIKSETTIVRSSGASDGVTPLSLNIATTANTSSVVPLMLEEISIDNQLVGSSRTLTMYLTSNTTLHNNDIWMVVEYPSDASSPKGSLVSNQCSPIATPTVLTSDSSTWGGSTTNKYSMSVSFLPNQAGPIKVRVYVGTPSLTGIYLDFKPVIT